MKLWMVEVHGWGWAFTVVRAETKEDALRVSREKWGRRIEVTELPHRGDEAILWSWEHSPDSPRD